MDSVIQPSNGRGLALRAYARSRQNEKENLKISALAVVSSAPLLLLVKADEEAVLVS